MSTREYIQNRVNVLYIVSLYNLQPKDRWIVLDCSFIIIKYRCHVSKRSCPFLHSESAKENWTRLRYRSIEIWIKLAGAARKTTDLDPNLKQIADPAPKKKLRIRVGIPESESVPRPLFPGIVLDLSKVTLLDFCPGRTQVFIQHQLKKIGISLRIKDVFAPCRI